MGGFEQLAIPLFAYEMQDIVANDSVPSSIDTYRLVLATYAFGFATQFGEVLKARLGDVRRDRKLKMLLRFDPFEKKWNVVAADQGYKGVDKFDTDRVGNALQRLKAGS